MNVIFVEPAFPANQRDFVRGLKEAGANVIGIGESSRESLDGELKSWLLEYIQVGSVCDEAAMIEAVKFVQSKMWVDRLEATVEAHILPTARVREACTIPGLSYQTCYLCRDKPAMKEALRKANVPCAQSLGSGDVEEIVEFARRVGYPLIVKPRSGAGAAGTSRAGDEVELRQALEASHVGRGGEVAVEEFIEGHEAFYDTLCVGGHVIHDFVSHYYPNVLEAMRTRWISPQIVVTNRVESADRYGEVKEMGRRVIQALGITTAATHMEWFFGSKGLKFSEIGCRPPGVRVWDLYQIGNDFDIYREWANLIVHGTPGQTLSRRFSTGIITFRPDRDGHIAGYEGLAEIESRFGDWIVDYHIPPEGTPTQEVGAGYMANAWMRFKHPDYDTLRSIMDDAGKTIQVRAR